MNYHFGMQILQSQNDRGDHEFSLALSEPGHLGEMIPQITSFHEMHEQVEVVFVLEGVEHVDDEPMPQNGEKLSFIEYAVYTSLGDDSELNTTYIAFDISFIA